VVSKRRRRSKGADEVEGELVSLEGVVLSGKASEWPRQYNRPLAVDHIVADDRDAGVENCPSGMIPEEVL
jgi:hypothetical protein